MNQSRERFQARLKQHFAYVYNDEQYKKVQQLVDRLRKAIATLTSLDPMHKERLLRKLEVVQQELHPRMSNFDRVAGFVLDASVLLRIAHENVTPIIADVKELSRIVIEVVKSTVGLPSGSEPTLLESGEEENTTNKE